MWYNYAVTGASKKIVFASGERKKSQVVEPRVIFGVPTSGPQVHINETRQQWILSCLHSVLCTAEGFFK
jgi:hypothetical protein